MSYLIREPCVIFVSWNMQAASVGNQFYECLSAELRTVAPLPAEIRTKELFSAMFPEGSTDYLSPVFLSSLEGFLNRSCKIVVQGGGAVIAQSHLPEPDSRLSVYLRWDGRRFSSVNCNPSDDMRAELAQLELWLRSIQSCVSASNNNPSVAVHIVGTHLDCALADSKHRLELVNRVIQVSGLCQRCTVHEVGAYSRGAIRSNTGIADLDKVLLRDISAMPAARQMVPITYVEVMKAVHIVESERRTQKICLLLSH